MTWRANIWHMIIMSAITRGSITNSSLLSLGWGATGVASYIGGASAGCSAIIIARPLNAARLFKGATLTQFTS